MKRAAVAGAERAHSQTLKAQIMLRELVVGGEIRPGERVSELQMVERFGVSRTPVRMALVRLAEEGLLEAIPSGGFAVKTFTRREVFDAIEIRGTLEGLAARLAAERGASRRALARAEACLDGIDAVVADAAAELDVPRYVELNAQFHAAILELADAPALTRQLERASALPFASPSALVTVQSSSPKWRYILTIAQDQHRCVLSAIARREGSRAEAVMREHARIAQRNLEHAFANETILKLVPGATLIRRAAAA
ncbi:GntR family transcriptional regulator [Enterovirga aerilata]|uniref:GntR family transcriptional regulator n=1 Tax=Enterovirga aerilata TaxID=2730920 RepID=A0A849I5R9_9HYPH|nr:GntR family transcriptional regulator [Enterovirga sp. DB1703]NNM72728.1 GntR family transcriptional regulator [Enterovirga sp. DB1703]